jgi:hypothetical protein
MTEITINIKIDDLNQIVKTEIQKVLSLVADQYNLNQTDVIEKMLSIWKCDFESIYPDLLKNKDDNAIDSENLCLARKPDLNRCTRNRKKNTEYCPSHQQSRPYGRIDKEPSQDLIKKSKNQKCQVMIKVQPKLIDSKQYFIDDQNHLYIIEKNKSKDQYRWVGDWDESNQKIIPKDSIKTTETTTDITTDTTETTTDTTTETNLESIPTNSDKISKSTRKNSDKDTSNTLENANVNNVNVNNVNVKKNSKSSKSTRKDTSDIKDTQDTLGTNETTMTTLINVKKVKKVKKNSKSSKSTIKDTNTEDNEISSDGNLNKNIIENATTVNVKNNSKSLKTANKTNKNVEKVVETDTTKIKKYVRNKKQDLLKGGE